MAAVDPALQQNVAEVRLAYQGTTRHPVVRAARLALSAQAAAAAVQHLFAQQECQGERVARRNWRGWKMYLFRELEDVGWQYRHEPVDSGDIVVVSRRWMCVCSV